MTVNQKDSLNLLKQLYSYLDISICCEECSTDEHPILMNQIEGIWFKCPLCKKSVMVMANIKTNVGTHYGTDCERCQELEKKHGITFGRQR